MLNSKVKKYLDKLEQEKKALVSSYGEHDIARKINNILKIDEKYKPSKEDMSEQMAFDFMAESSNDDSGWGTYYGPMYILPNEKGQMVEYPSISLVDQEVLKYWTKRAKESKYSIFSSRYADLVVDFSPKILTQKADISLVQIIIDSNIAICEKSLAESLDRKTKIKRALTLAVQINDQERISKVKSTIIKLEKDIAVDSKPGLWGFAFRWLLLDFPNKVILEEVEKSNLINEIEERLKRVEKDTYLVENSVSLLAEYYANTKDEKNLMRVLSILENSLKTDERLNSDALLKIDSYEQIHEIYRKYASSFAEAENANKRISQEISQLNLDWNKSLQRISFETEIKQENIEKHLEDLFGKDKNDNLEIVMNKIATRHLPRKNDIEKELDDISRTCPLQFLCTSQIISDDGVPIAKIANINEDYDNHFYKYALQHIQLNSFSLFLTMDELQKQFSKEKVLEYFEKSDIIGNDNQEYLNRAISAYWDKDYLVSSHLFNPLIERGIRELVRICGGSVLKLNELNGFDYVSLGRLLKNNEEIFEEVFSASGHNVSFYFRLVLVEKIGMNLRNDFAHGRGKKKFLGREASDRLFHILILLSIISKQEN